MQKCDTQLSFNKIFGAFNGSVKLQPKQTYK